MRLAPLFLPSTLLGAPDRRVLFASRLPAHAVERLPVRAGGRGRPGAGVAVHRGDHLLFLSSDRVQAAAYEDGLGERHLPGHRLCRAGSRGRE
eukprot:8790829-Pyramimonas_sp.AAC.1